MNAPEYIQELIHGEEVNTTTAILGKSHKLQISQYNTLSNLISFILVGALKPEDVVRGIEDMLGLAEENALALAKDLDKTILEKARIQVLGKTPADMVTLTFPEGKSPDELRKEILDTTKKGSLATGKPSATSSETPIAPVPKPKSEKPNLIPGSRMALMDQLKLLDDIPDDDEIAERLKKIQEQIATRPEDDHTLDPSIPLQAIMPKNGESLPVEAVPRTAPFKTPPTKYSVDPYREVVEE